MRSLASDRVFSAWMPLAIACDETRIFGLDRRTGELVDIGGGRLGRPGSYRIRMQAFPSAAFVQSVLPSSAPSPAAGAVGFPVARVREIAERVLERVVDVVRVNLHADLDLVVLEGLYSGFHASRISGGSARCGDVHPTGSDADDLPMRVRGLEPPRGLPHQDLNLARLPFRHTRAREPYRSRAPRSGHAHQEPRSAARPQGGFPSPARQLSAVAADRSACTADRAQARAFTDHQDSGRGELHDPSVWPRLGQSGSVSATSAP